ncbi:hypothetical protein GUJ93_ZPchr0010g8295 [Zizania palustris]|uniref:Secreted protein n=1 Tax=Zizania palustris TaxID=103762 RepID=A0A8J5W887_ZIZPA|nr:hypothetical protein GUJ93_ZPchr0010g8295 [Zizania palustris]
MAAAAAAAAFLSTSACALRRLSSPASVVSCSAQFKRFDRVRRFTPAAMSPSSGPKEAPANNQVYRPRSTRRPRATSCSRRCSV